ncbi:SMI1/KNR4 family protein [Tenacibaculum sp. 190130A14a]
MNFIRDDKRVNVEDLEKLELLISNSLPKDYVQHMIEFNGGYLASGGVKNYYYDNKCVSFGRLFDLDKVKDMFNVKHEFLVNQGILSIGSVVGGYIGMGYSHNNLGEVFVYYSDGKTEKVAESFSEFIEELTLEEDDFL